MSQAGRPTYNVVKIPGDGIGPEVIEQALRVFCESHELSPKELFMPVRIALTGRTATPPLFDTMEVLGKERCRWRLRRAMETLRGMKA
mgnify:CR=1 FL=1